MKKTITVVLNDGTVGTVDENVKIGDYVFVMLHDENGNHIFKTGNVIEILN